MAWAVALVPLAGAVAAALLRRRPAAVVAVCVGAVAVGLLTAVWAAATAPSAGWSWGPVLGLQLAAEGFARVMVVLVPTVALPIIVYAAATEQADRTRLLALMVAFVGAMQLLVLAGDFLALLVGWELVGAASWALIAHGWRDADNPRQALHAFVTTRAGDLGLYLAAGLTFAATGSLSFSELAGVPRPLADGIAAGVLVAAAAKSAQLPFSPWLFSAMAGPTPVSALLHSATLVAAGAYALVRLTPQLGAVVWLPPAVVTVGLATALAGGLVASVQTHAKRVLAASTSAQYGLMFVAVGVGSTAAAGAHLVTHALFKSLLFLGAGVAIHAAASSRLADMRLGSSLRAVAVCSGVGAAALAAVPPLGAAWSKDAVVAAAVHASGWLGAGVFAAALLSAFYAGRYHLLAFGPSDRSASAPRHRPGRLAVASLAWLAAGTLALSLLWLPQAATLVEAATAPTLVHPTVWELAVSLAAIAAAFALVWGLGRRDRLTGLGLPAGLQAHVGQWLGVPQAARLLVVDPVRAAAAVLAGFDDRVVDAGVRGAARFAGLLSRMVWRRAEWTIDGAVRGIAAAALHAAAGARAADERGVDVSVEGSARAVGLAGARSRDLQSGLSHRYYVILAAGLAATVLVLVVLR